MDSKINYKHSKETKVLVIRKINTKEEHNTSQTKKKKIKFSNFFILLIILIKFILINSKFKKKNYYNKFLKIGETIKNINIRKIR